MNRVMFGFGILVIAVALSVGSAARAPETSDSDQTPATEAGRGPAAKKPAAPRDNKYLVFQVPAGTLLPIELRTTLASDSSHVEDPVQGRLRDAIVMDDVELVPAGASVLGTVMDSAPALRTNDRGHLSFRFSVLEHPETGSRVMIRTVLVAFEADGIKPKRAQKDPAALLSPPAYEVRLRPGADVSATLLEPFIVRIPRS